MTRINLKFSPDMEQAVLEGRKCCTTRDGIKGERGDTFVVQDRIYRVVDIISVLYEDIFVYALMDGFSNKYAYLRRLQELYDLESNAILTVHFFAFVGYNGFVK